MIRHELDAEHALANATMDLILAKARLDREGPTIPLWDAVHAAEDKVANLKARQKGP